MTEKEDLLDEAADLGLDFPTRVTIATIKDAIAKKKGELEGEEADEDPDTEEEEEDDDQDEDETTPELVHFIHPKETTLTMCRKKWSYPGDKITGDSDEITCDDCEAALEKFNAESLEGEDEEEEEPEKEVPKGPVYSCGCGFQGTKEQVDYHVETSHPVEKMDPKENFTQVLTQQGMKGARKLINDENELKEMLENSSYELLVSTADNMKIPTHGDMDALVERLMNPPKPVKGRDYYQLNDYFLPTGGKVALPKGPVIISTFEKTIADKDHAIPGLMVRVLEKV